MLLAYKPYYYDPDRNCLVSTSAPHLEWPQRRIVVAPCQYHHYDPVKNCTCGMLSTLSAEYVRNFYINSPELDIENSELIPVLMTVQVLGNTIIDDNENVRSWGIFLYGIVAGEKYEASYTIVRNILWRKYQLVYSSMADSLETVFYYKNKVMESNSFKGILYQGEQKA